jgi:hypothetical protein
VLPTSHFSPLLSLPIKPFPNDQSLISHCSDLLLHHHFSHFPFFSSYFFLSKRDNSSTRSPIPPQLKESHSPAVPLSKRENRPGLSDRVPAYTLHYRAAAPSIMGAEENKTSDVPAVPESEFESVPLLSEGEGEIAVCHQISLFVRGGHK